MPIVRFTWVFAEHNGLGMRSLLDRTKADELIVVSDVYDFQARLRSFEIISNAAAGTWRAE